MPHTLPLLWDDLTHTEHKRFWPTSKIDTIIDIPVNTDENIPTPAAAEMLLATSIYVELDETPVFYIDSPLVVVTVAIISVLSLLMYHLDINFSPEGVLRTRLAP